MINKTILRERCLRGAQWLDEVVPGWGTRIDITTLDLLDGEHCICGQTFDVPNYRNDIGNGYDVFLTDLWSQARDWLLVRCPDNRDPDVQMGFALEPLQYSMWEAYRMLQKTWEELLHERASVSA